MGGTRKKVVLTVEEKLRAIKRMDAGETVLKIATELGVGKSTVGDWKKNRDKIIKWSSTKCNGRQIKKRKTMYKGRHGEIGQALFSWFEDMTEKDGVVTGAMIKEKALQLKVEIEGEHSEFTASEGWVDRWKKRYAIRQRPINGELAVCSDTDDRTDGDTSDITEGQLHSIKVEADLPSEYETQSFVGEDSDMSMEDNKPELEIPFGESGMMIDDRLEGERDERLPETDETRDLTTTELKRLVLLEQLKYFRKKQQLAEVKLRREMQREREEANSLVYVVSEEDANKEGFIS